MERNAAGYYYYPEGEVGYPVSVKQHEQEVSNLHDVLFWDEIELRFLVQPKPNSPSELVKEEEKSSAKAKATNVHLESDNLPGENKRKSSINLYQSVDDDHPDLQSIQNIVANMTFSADWLLYETVLLAGFFSRFCFYPSIFM